MTAIGLGIFAMVAAAAGRAEASCARPEWVGTPAGVTVPEKGVLYRFSAFDGPEAQMSRYDAAKAEELGLVVDAEWKPPAEAPRVLAIQHSKYDWTCSEENALAIQLDQAVAAVRVFWATSAGQHEMVIAPRPKETPRGRPASILLLGKLNCASENIPVEDLERGVVLGLTAIRFDGSEVAIDGVPTIVALGDYPVSKNGVSALGFDVITEEAAEVAAPERPWRPKTNGAFPIALMLGAIVLGARRGFVGAKACDVKLPSATAKR